MSAIVSFHKNGVQSQVGDVDRVIEIIHKFPEMATRMLEMDAFSTLTSIPAVKDGKISRTHSTLNVFLGKENNDGTVTRILAGEEVTHGIPENSIVCSDLTSFRKAYTDLHELETCIPLGKSFWQRV